MSKRLFLFLLLVIYPHSIYPQSIEYAGSTLWSGANDIVVDGDYGYCAFPEGLLILDISDPSTPINHSQLFLQQNRGMALVKSGDLVYFADGKGGLKIIDVDNPLNPFLIGEYDTPGFANDLKISGNYVFIADNDSGLQVINVLNPAAPVRCGVLPTIGLFQVIAIDGDYAYIGNGYRGEGFQIVNIADPQNPLHTGGLNLSGLKGIVVRDQYAYTILNGVLLTIIDISDPAEPSIVGQERYDIHCDAADIEVRGDYAYASSSNGAWLEVFDISNPANPVFRNSLRTGPWNGRRFCLRDSIAYVCDSEYGIFSVNINDPDSMGIIGQYQTPGMLMGFALYGNAACVTSTHMGMTTVDIANPESPRYLAMVNSTYGMDQIGIYDRFAMVTDASLQLNTIELADIANPELISSVPLETYAGDLKISGHYAFIGENFSGLNIYDIRFPDSPVMIGSVPNGLWDWSISVSGNYAYFIAHNRGMRIIDITDPQNPISIIDYDSLGGYVDVMVQGNYAYLTGNGLSIVDISDPYNPQLIGTSPPAYYGPLFVSGIYAYASRQTSSNYFLSMLDISNPSAPTVVAEYLSPNGVHAINAVDDLIYLTTDRGFLILRFNSTGISDNDVPNSFSLIHNYPNPFNAQTTISYSLAKSGPVTLTIYNLLGQKVATLFDGIQTAGEHSLVWDAKNQPSGVYFYRLNGQNFAKSSQMILLR